MPKVIRIIKYKGSEEALEKQLGCSMPDGINNRGPIEITVKTIYSDLSFPPDMDITEEDAEAKLLFDPAEDHY